MIHVNVIFSFRCFQVYPSRGYIITDDQGVLAQVDYPELMACNDPLSEGTHVRFRWLWSGVRDLEVVSSKLLTS